MAAASGQPNPWRADRPPSGWPVWGHDGAVASLQREVSHDRVRHAYLISGPEGIGKQALALAFAQVLCCQEPPAPGLACGVCRACLKIARGVHPDVQMVSLAAQAATAGKSGGKNTSLTIETVRGLTATAALRPLEGRWRIVIIADAETMLEPAQEALLKTLEEPPPYVVLLLLAQNAELLLPTIRSRCQTIELRPVPRPTVVTALRARGVADSDAEAIAAMAGGRPGWAIRASEDPTLPRQRREAVTRAMAWIDAPHYERMVTAFRLGDTFGPRRSEVFADLDILLGVWRDILLLQASRPDLLTHRDDPTRLQELAGAWTLTDTYRAVCAVQSCIGDLETNVRPRLALENMVLQWPRVRAVSSI